MTKFSLIAAVTRNFGIGHQNRLPWKKFGSDMTWFRETTLNQTVIMGRKTWESMNKRALPNRQNIVITSNAEKYEDEETHNLTFHSNLSYALTQVTTDKTYIIGGTSLYQLAMNHPGCESMLITHTNINLPADTYFPEIHTDKFKLGKIYQSGNEKIILHQEDQINQGDSIIEQPDVSYEIVEYLPLPQNNKIQFITPKYLRGYLNEAGYLQALDDIINYGESRGDRTGTGTKALFGLNFRYDLLKGFPLLTTKRMFTDGVIGELLWFLRGETDVKILQNKGIHIWDGNSTREFLDQRGLSHLPEWDIGPSYGFQFRHSGADYVNSSTNYTGKGVDQVAELIHQLKTNPNGRRAIINLWNPSDLNQMALPPCLFQYQFWVSEGKFLKCSLYQRSADMGLGVPFNIASASLLTHLLAKLTGLIPTELIHTIGDAHIYLDHIEPLQRQISRPPRPLPRLLITDRSQTIIEDFQESDFTIEGYHPYPGIKMMMAI